MTQRKKPGLPSEKHTNPHVRRQVFRIPGPLHDKDHTLSSKRHSMSESVVLVALKGSSFKLAGFPRLIDSPRCSKIHYHEFVASFGKNGIKVGFVFNGANHGSCNSDRKKQCFQWNRSKKKSKS